MLVLYSLLVPSTGYAGISVSLTLDRAQATTADSVTLVVSVSGARKSDVEPAIKNLSNFYVSSGGTASRIQIINGRMDAAVDFTYFLQPKRTGAFTIGPATVVLDGRTYTSNTVALRVSRQNDSRQQDKGPVFLETSLSSHKAYVEQQVIYTLRLFRRVKVSDISLNLPDTEGLTFKKLGEASGYRSMRQGRLYQVLEVRYAVIPTRPGEKVVGPTTMAMTVYEPTSRRHRSLFGDPFFDDPFFSMSTGRPITVSGEPLKLEVRPLPAAGRPDDFSGLVGTFRINATLAPLEVKAGESATLTVRVSGNGNVSRIPNLHLPETPDLKVYADEPVLEVKPDKDGMGGSKTMKWALVPEKAGTYQIASLGLSFFDTASESYRRLKTVSFSLSVRPGAEKPERQPVKTCLSILPCPGCIRPGKCPLRVARCGRFYWGPGCCTASAFSGFDSESGLETHKLPRGLKKRRGC
ncbi:MAG: protein BatD [Deltaproteobacteria bacterium]|nr:protein BatD [Deltaproteobacteria bacterium]